MDLISVVVPCHNEQDALPLLYTALCQVAAAMPGQRFEYLLVNDGSRDGTLAVMRELAARDERVKYISLSRNFGKEAAMLAGFQHAGGDYIAVMDADGQDPPELLEQMYRRLKDEGCDCVATRRVDRKGEPRVRSFFARMFYRLIRRISDTEFVDGARDYRLMTRQMLNAVLALPEVNRFSKGIFGWVGFDTRWIEYVNVQRTAGETKWSFWKLLLYSVDGIVAFSTAPLAIASFAGIFFCILAGISLLFVVIRAAIYGDPVPGWPSTASIILMVGGLQLFGIGVLGQYLAKTYLETKRRPMYIVKDTNLPQAAERKPADDQTAE